MQCPNCGLETSGAGGVCHVCGAVLFPQTQSNPTPSGNNFSRIEYAGNAHSHSGSDSATPPWAGNAFPRAGRGGKSPIWKWKKNTVITAALALLCVVLLCGIVAASGIGKRSKPATPSQPAAQSQGEVVDTNRYKVQQVIEAERARRQDDSGEASASGNSAVPASASSSGSSSSSGKSSSSSGNSASSGSSSSSSGNSASSGSSSSSSGNSASSGSSSSSSGNSASSGSSSSSSGNSASSGSSSSSSGNSASSGNSSSSSGNSASSGDSASSGKTKSGYLLDGSDSRYIKRSELTSFTKEQCRLARNEIYARHGRKFQDKSIQAYFDSCDWYTPSIEPGDFSESTLNAYESANRDLILNYEKEKGYQ